MRRVFNFTRGPSVATSQPATDNIPISSSKIPTHDTDISTKCKASTKHKASTTGKSSTKGKASTKSKATADGKAFNKGSTTTKGKATKGKGKPSDDTEEESMMEEETSDSGLDADVPPRLPVPARSCSRNSGLANIRTLSEEENVDDIGHSALVARMFDGFRDSVSFDDDEYNPRASPPPDKDEMMYRILQGGSMHNGRSYRSGTDPFSKLAVDLLDPHPHQCLVTRELDWEDEVEYCHLFDRSNCTNHALLMALEYSFGIGYKKFNIDDARNIARLIINLHRRVDKNRSIVLPTMDMVRRLSKHKRGEDIRKIYEQGEVFTYHFLPLGEPTSNIIRYQRTDKGDQPSARDTAMESHLYPFHTLPSLLSHVEPHYVVINAAQKLLSIGQGQSRMQLLRSIAAVYNVDLSAAQKFLVDIDLLYKAWKEPAPDDFAIPKAKKEAQVDGNKGREDAGDVGTSSNHTPDLNHPAKRQRPSPTSSEKNVVTKYKSMKSAAGSVASRITRK